MRWICASVADYAQSAATLNNCGPVRMIFDSPFMPGLSWYTRSFGAIRSAVTHCFMLQVLIDYRSYLLSLMDRTDLEICF